jgi:L-glyceraldehyde 3-phosphate reductase
VALRQEGRPSATAQGNPSHLAAAARLLEIAATRNQTPAQLALAWTLANRAITAAIMGASSIAQLESNLPAFDLEMSAEEGKALSEAMEAPSPAQKG